MKHSLTFVLTISLILSGCTPDESGCIDSDAINFNSEATVDDGSCVYGPTQCVGASTVTFDGYTYDLVSIANRCWFAENLRTEHYANGDVIPANRSDFQWNNIADGYVAVYGEGNSDCDSSSPDGDACDSEWSLNEYGRLYNWYAVEDERGLCPSGWHVPTDNEWVGTANFLGETEVASAEMRTTYGWFADNNGTNSSGFSALPGGMRWTDGSFSGAGGGGNWWSSSQEGNSSLNAWSWGLSWIDYQSGLSAGSKKVGRSVRCIKDV